MWLQPKEECCSQTAHQQADNILIRISYLIFWIKEPFYVLDLDIILLTFLSPWPGATEQHEHNGGEHSQQ